MLTDIDGNRLPLKIEKAFLMLIAGKTNVKQEEKILRYRGRFGRYDNLHMFRFSDMDILTNIWDRIKHAKTI